MRKENNKKREKMNLLLQAFKEKKELTAKEICTIVDSSSKQTAQNYIANLKKEGYGISGKQVGTKFFYYLELNDETASLSEYEDIDVDVIRKFLILRELQSEPMNAEALKIALLEQDAIGVSDTTILNLINELKEEQDIIWSEKDKKYYLTGNRIPYVQSFRGLEEVFRVFEELSNVPKSDANYGQLRSVFNKLGVLLDMVEEDENNINNENYLLYGRNYYKSDEINHSIEKLSQYDYKNKVLDIIFKSSRKDEDRALLALGMIVYSVEKDKIYLFGKNMQGSLNKSFDGPEPSDKSKEDIPEHSIDDYIIKVDSIIEIKETKIENKHFNSSYFQNIFETMFSISTDNEEQVCVEFTKIGNVQEKIKNLHKNRKHSRIEDRGKSILYTDTIRGIYDFSNYLREFGKSARVIESENLLSFTKKSIQRGLDLYDEQNKSREDANES